jgi:hypothetical protein
VRRLSEWREVQFEVLCRGGVAASEEPAEWAVFRAFSQWYELRERMLAAERAGAWSRRLRAPVCFVGAWSPDQRHRTR